MLSGAFNIDFWEKNPIDLFYRKCHNEAVGTIKSEIDQLAGPLWVGQTKNVLRDPSEVRKFYKRLYLYKMDQVNRFCSQIFISLVN